MTLERVGSSFRDPSGHLFLDDGVLLRRVERSYGPHYDKLMASGLYDRLVQDGLLVPHVEREPSPRWAGAFKVLEPERIPFVSMPYEWSFGQLRAAALLTLRVQALAMQAGMTLKDASAFNVQFRGSQPVLVDTLSFAVREAGAPWVAYRQFCQHFLGPLALQALVDVRLRELGRSQLDGVPLDLVSRLLPASTRLRPWAMLHLHVHAKSIARHASTRDGGARAAATRRVSDQGLAGIVDHLRSAVASLEWKPAGTEWGDYERTHGYDQAGQAAKRDLVARLVARVAPRRVIDLGANTGDYSRIARDAGAKVVALDGDPAAVELGYRRLATAGDREILPLWVDLANPSPSQGWAHREWGSLASRINADLVLALALVHHLAIGNNVPLEGVAEFMALLGRDLVIEWVPKEDPQVQRLLSSREDIFVHYSEAGFVEAMSTRYRVEAREPVGQTGRVLFLLRAR